MKTGHPDTCPCMHPPTATNAFQLLLSGPFLSPRRRREQKPQVLPRASIPFCKAGGKGGEELLQFWPFGLPIQSEPQPSTSMDPSQVLSPSITGACCPLVTTTLTCRRKSSNYQTKDGETGLRKPQALDANEEGAGLQEAPSSQARLSLSGASP